MATYTTMSGDMWDDIAFRILGDQMRVSELFRLNSDKLDYFIFPEGIQLRIPDQADTDAAYESGSSPRHSSVPWR